MTFTQKRIVFIGNKIVPLDDETFVFIEQVGGDYYHKNLSLSEIEKKYNAPTKLILFSIHIYSEMCVVYCD